MDYIGKFHVGSEMLFLGTIAVRHDGCIYKQITVHKMHQFIDGMTKGMVNRVDSSIIDPMGVAIMCNI